MLTNLKFFFFTAEVLKYHKIVFILLVLIVDLTSNLKMASLTLQKFEI